MKAGDECAVVFLDAPLPDERFHFLTHHGLRLGPRAGDQVGEDGSGGQILGGEMGVVAAAYHSYPLSFKGFHRFEMVQGEKRQEAGFKQRPGSRDWIEDV